jgi:zinc transport system substrate-binding protein
MKIKIFFGSNFLPAFKFLLFLLILLITLSGVFSCSSGNEVQKDQEKGELNIIVSILPQSEFAEKIGGDKVNVTVMVPPGADPHIYEAKPDQLRAVSNAALYMKLGSGLEFELAWMDKISGINRNMSVIDCSRGIDLIKGNSEETGSGTDPHIWLSPGNVKIIIENMFQGIVDIDTLNNNALNKQYYESNKENYLQEINNLDKEITRILSTKKNKNFMVYHPAWTYFAKDYGLVQIPIEIEGKEPTPRGLEYLIKQAKENNIKVIFASPQFSTKSAEVIAKEIGGTVILIDPLEKDYIKNMEKVAKIFDKYME